jgi:hypothetical protein
MSNSEVQVKMTKVSQLEFAVQYPSSLLCQRLHREIRIWETLSHDNVLPFHGTTSGFGPHKAMVCSWAQNGNLNDYLRDSEVRLRLSDRFNIVRKVPYIMSPIFY